MSDHDRGAYTPNTDAPLSFDARQSRGRRAFPTTLLISLVVLIGLTLAIFMFYRSGVRGAGAGLAGAIGWAGTGTTGRAWGCSGGGAKAAAGALEAGASALPSAL